MDKKINIYREGKVHINTGLQKRNYTELIKLVGFKKDEKVFDAGCANGFLGKYLKDVHLIGGDLNIEPGQRIQGYEEVFKCDIEKFIPLEANEVDSVVSISVFQYLHDVDKAFRQCLRVAKERVIINVPNSKLLQIQHAPNPDKLNYIDSKVLRDLGKKYGVKCKIIYLSNKFDSLRKLLGHYLSGGIIAIYTKN